MWPLCAANEDGDTRAWCDGVEHTRSYYNDFKCNWTHIHDASLCRSPLPLDRSEDILKGLKKNLRSEADACLQLLSRAALPVESVAHDVPSLWSWIDQPSLKSSDYSDSRGSDRAEEKEQQHAPYEIVSIDRIKCVDVDQSIDRRDRRSTQEVVSRLRNRASRTFDLVTGAASLPEECSLTCPSILEPVWEPAPRPRPEAIRLPALSREEEVKRTGVVSLRLLDTPDRRIPTRTTGWTTLKTQAQQVIDSVVKHEDTSYNVLEHIRTRSSILSILEMFEPPTAQATRVPRPVEVEDDSNTERPAAMRITTAVEEIVPRRIKFDGLLKPYASPSPLSDVAAAILKSIAKKNASLLLVGAVSDTLSSDIGSLLRRASIVYNSRGAGAGSSSRDGLRLLSAPTDVVQRDEERIEQANVSIGLAAQRCFKSISSPGISLTSLSLSLPSLWRDEFVLVTVEAHKVKQWTASHRFEDHQDQPSQLVPGEEVPCGPPELVAEVSRRDDGAVEVNKSGEIITSCITVVNRSVDTDVPVQERPAPVLVVEAQKTKVAFKIQSNISTDELVTSFLGCDVDDHQQQLQCDTTNRPPVACSPASGPSFVSHSKFAILIDQLARPAVWFLSRTKLLRVQSVAMLDALKAVPLEVLATIVFQLQAKLANIVSNPSKASQEETMETCAAFRHVAWLHILRMIIEHQDGAVECRLLIASRVMASECYKKAIGTRQTKALSNLYVSMGGKPLPETVETESPVVAEPPLKKPRVDRAQSEQTQVRVICSDRLLERDELIEELSELAVSVLERELPPAIDIVVDEHNAITLLTGQHFADEKLMKVLTYELATAQVQFRKLWLIIDVPDCESALHIFYAALTNFKIEVQTFVCHGDEDAAQVIRGIVDASAEAALSLHRVLPRMWFARPYMLEEESQLERFLSSTRIINTFAAQSVLYRLSLEELTTKR